MRPQEHYHFVDINCNLQTIKPGKEKTFQVVFVSCQRHPTKWDKGQMLDAFLSCPWTQDTPAQPWNHVHSCLLLSPHCCPLCNGGTVPLEGWHSRPVSAAAKLCYLDAAPGQGAVTANTVLWGSVSRVKCSMSVLSSQRLRRVTLQLRELWALCERKMKPHCEGIEQPPSFTAGTNTENQSVFCAHIVWTHNRLLGGNKEPTPHFAPGQGKIHLSGFGHPELLSFFLLLQTSSLLPSTSSQSPETLVLEPLHTHRAIMHLLHLIF